MSMKINGRLDKLSGQQITITADDSVSLYTLSKLAAGKRPSVELEVDDGRHISPDQRKKIFALMRDISDWNGDTVDMIECLMKSYTREIFVIEPYSLSDCSMTTASNMIYTILEFCFRNDVPFKTKTWDMIPNDYARQWFCLRFRKCVICGKPADLAHYEAVGMGRNRNKIDESQYHYMD
ncbi:putative HNHc nuclease [Lacticaseibacillus paracasei]|uniref:putative HNHc nuclease n=1 Tax=Lacticaseibacillus paracasei TaxID=1597 RepID=UPI003D03EEAE